MKNLQDYQTRQAALCEWYDRIVENHELLKVDVEALQEAKSNLQEGRFIVAVCGEMNSGKSTLLNALLFSEEVLPSHVTTMTAKIALMAGDETEQVEATLYTPDDFRHVVEASKRDERSAQELAEARETARAEGLRESDLLTNPARVISEDGLDKLVQFAAVCSRGGIYSAYVNWVQLWADRPWLHQVTVADTPGTNDPNPERDKITRKWIQRADAVVYVTFAGQAMTGEDVKFIDEHLAHIDPQRRIIAVNKCDTQPDKEAILSHIRKTRDSDDLRMKVLFGNDDQIVLVSGLGALVSAMQEAGRPLSEDLTWHARELSGKGYLDPERHGLDRLRNVIERRIIATKGDGIIEAHQRRLDSVFESADAGISQDKAISMANREAINASQEERREEEERIRESITSIDSVVKNARDKFDKDLDEAKGPLKESIDETIRKILQKIGDDLSSVQTINNMAGIAMSIGNHLYNNRNDLAHAISNIVSKIEGMLNQAENGLSEKLLASGFIVDQGPRYHLLPISSHTICQEVEAELRNKLNHETLQSTVKAATTWWQRIVNTSLGKSEAVKQLKIELESLLQETLDGLSKHTERKLLNLGQNALKTMQGSCGHILNERQELLEDLQKEISSDEDRRQEIDDQLVELDRRKLQVDELKAEYDLARSA